MWQYHGWYSSWSPDWGGVRFIHCEIPCFFPLSILYSWKEVIVCSPYLRTGELCSHPTPSLMVRVSYVRYSEFFMGEFSFSPLYLLIFYYYWSSFTYVIMDVCFIFWVIIKSILFCCPISYSLAPVSLWLYHHQCEFLLFGSISLLSGTIRYSRLFLYVSCTSLRISHLSEESGSFCLKIVLETKVGCQVHLLWLGYLCFQAFSCEKSKEYVYIYKLMYDFTCFYMFVYMHIFLCDCV